MDGRRILIAGIGVSLALAMWETIVEAVIPDGAGSGESDPLRYGRARPGPDGQHDEFGDTRRHLRAHRDALALSAAGTIGLGMAWGVAVFAMMWFVVVPAIEPLMLNLDAAVFFAAHLMWGAALGVIWTRYGSTSSELGIAR